MTLEELYKTQQKHFIHKVYSYLSGWDEAEEVVQEAFLKAFTKLDTYDPEKGLLKNWFYSVLFSTLWGHKRALKRVIFSTNPEGFESLVEEHSKNISLFFEDVQNDFHRKVLLTYFMFGYTYGETADVYGISKHNVRKIVQRFKKQFVLEI